MISRGFYFWKQSPRLNNAPPMAGMSVQHNCIPPKKKKMLSKESTYNLQFLLCLLCICYFIGLLCHISMKCSLFCWRKIECDFLHQRKNFWLTRWHLFIWPWKQVTLQVHSMLITSIEENVAWSSCIIEKNIFFQQNCMVALIFLKQQVTLHLHFMYHADDHNIIPFFKNFFPFERKLL